MGIVFNTQVLQLQRGQHLVDVQLQLVRRRLRQHGWRLGKLFRWPKLNHRMIPLTPLAPKSNFNAEVYLRPILNFTPRGKLWHQGISYPPGVTFVPWGWNSIIAPPFFLTVESVHTLGWTKGWTFPLGDKVHPWGPGVKLIIAIWSHTYDFGIYNFNVSVVVR
jgi:hypothetical protein